MNEKLLTEVDWNANTPETRNAWCAIFMPPSEVNPLRDWHAVVNGSDHGALLVKNRAEADEWLVKVTQSPKVLRKLFPEFVATPIRVEIKEFTRHIRYSDTPGGAWTLIEKLRKDGKMVTIDATKDGVDILISNADAEPQSMTFGDNFPEVAAIAFLRAHGIIVKNFPTETKLFGGGGHPQAAGFTQKL